MSCLICDQWLLLYSQMFNNNLRQLYDNSSVLALWWLWRNLAYALLYEPANLVRPADRYRHLRTVVFTLFTFCKVCIFCLLSCIFRRDPTWMAVYCRRQVHKIASCYSRMINLITALLLWIYSTVDWIYSNISTVWETSSNCPYLKLCFYIFYHNVSAGKKGNCSC